MKTLEKLYFYGGETAVPEEGIVDLPNLRSLDMSDCHFPHFKWLAGMPSLMRAFFLNAEWESLEGLDSAPLLTDITCSGAMTAEIMKAYPNAEWRLHQ